jgi:hypothetical protein
VRWPCGSDAVRVLFCLDKACLPNLCCRRLFFVDVFLQACLLWKNGANCIEFKNRSSKYFLIKTEQNNHNVLDILFLLLRYNFYNGYYCHRHYHNEKHITRICKLFSTCSVSCLFYFHFTSLNEFIWARPMKRTTIYFIYK